jgi:hypothetical protein
MDGEYQTEVDFDGDGTWDEHDVQQTEDGSVLISGDMNHDGRTDVVAVDEDGDGLVDGAVYDTDYDGKPDETLIDTNHDGYLDREVDDGSDVPPSLHSA